MKKLFAIVFVLIMTLLLAACGDDDRDNGAENKPATNPTYFVSDGVTNEYVPLEKVDNLPAEVVGYWAVEEVFYIPEIKDPSPEDALALEQSTAIQISSEYFSHDSDQIAEPVYAVYTCDFEAMRSIGLNTSKLEERYGASPQIFQIEVKMSEGGYNVRKMWLIDGECLLAPGCRGNYYFTYKKGVAPEY